MIYHPRERGMAGLGSTGPGLLLFEDGHQSPGDEFGTRGSPALGHLIDLPEQRFLDGHGNGFRARSDARSPGFALGAAQSRLRFACGRPLHLPRPKANGPCLKADS